VAGAAGLTDESGRLCAEGAAVPLLSNSLDLIG
jgi:hypothetical protein